MTQRLHNAFPANSLAARDLASLLHPSTNLALHEQTGPLVIDRAEGVRVWDVDGKEYIEGMAGLWCTALGYGEESLADVAAAQMKKLAYSHMFGSKTTSRRSSSPRSPSWCRCAMGACSSASGSDANDTQVKLVRYYNNALGRPNKKKIISAKGYHGVTVASASPACRFPRTSICRWTGSTTSRRRIINASRSRRPRLSSPCLAAELEALIPEEDLDTVAAFIAEPAAPVALPSRRRLLRGDPGGPEEVRHPLHRR